MPCQARVLDAEKTFPGTSVTYHTTKECGRKENRRIEVDDGEASMGICTWCIPKYRNMQKTGTSAWLGWFDCEYPREARVKGSAWYYEQHTKLCDVSGLQVIIDLIDTELSAASSPAPAPAPQVQATPITTHVVDSSTVPAKKPRGRPRKNPLPS